MSDAVLHLQKINQRFDAVIQEITVAHDEISLEISAEKSKKKLPVCPGAVFI